LRFDPAKAIALEMEKSGIDISDRKAVDRFMAEFNERLARDPSLLPDIPIPADYRGRPKQSKAYVWTPGIPPPNPKRACPCGSGKPYRKCCMPH
jgi:hypothetical protein